MYKKTIILIAILMTNSIVYADTDEKSVQSKQETADVQNQEQWNQLKTGVDFLKQGKIQEAIDNLNTVISFFENQYANNKARLYTGRTNEQTMLYLLTAVADQKEAKIVSFAWSEAYYYIGYAFMELRDVEKAKSFLEKAINLSPKDSQYISELAHIYQATGDWKKSLELFQKAESAADFSPEQAANSVITRAKRGMGYSLLELGRLDEAEKKYRECLEIDKNDQTALNELEYIQNLRKGK